MSAAPVPAHPSPDPVQDVTLAWLSLLLFPITFLAAFGVGEGLATWLFGWPDGPEPEAWQVLVSTLPALLLFALPAWPAWRLGMRARRHGQRSGAVAAWLGVAIAVGFVLLNVWGYFSG